MQNKIYFFAFLMLLSLKIFSQVQHIEPLNWWVGMKNKNLQLLISAKDIGDKIPKISYPGVVIKKVSKADSKNYLFIDLEISEFAKPGNFLIQFLKNGKTVDTIRYTLLARGKNARSLKGFDASDVIYLMVPDRFANGDYSNDVVPQMLETNIDRTKPGGRHGGDIQGIIDHLDYLKNMGYTALWCTPMLENNMHAYSYHGYSITNHYAVDPRFGNLEKYKQLSSQAAANGIKIIFDEVLNHIGSNYWWMKDLPFKDWINFPGVYTPSNHRRTTNQDIYASSYDKQLMTNGWFDKTMPDMNGKNSYVANYLIQQSIWWIETLHLGGIRQDTYGYSDKNFLQQWSCRIMNEYPNFTLVGEEWSYNPIIESYWQSGKQNHDGYKSCLPAVMDFPLQKALVEALTDEEGKSFDNGLTRLYEALANDIAYANPNKLLVFGDNHDMDRLFTQLHRDVALTKMAMTYLLTIRGIPQIFYGTEILMDNTGHHKVDGIIRSDFPGGWKDDSANAFSGIGLQNDQLSMQQYVKQLLNWRKNNQVISSGKILHFAPFNGVYVYFRYNNKKTVMVIMNKNNQSIKIDNHRFSEILKSKKWAFDIFNGNKVALDTEIEAPAKTAWVLEIE